jgi:E3 ubiquitin-protein ligase UBR4
MRETNDPADIDAENFYRLVLIVRAIAVSRPHNLAKFAEQYVNKSIDENNGRSFAITFKLSLN